MSSVQNLITEILTAQFAPVHLEVVNESHRHNVPANAETHFKVTLVSAAFVGLNQVKRHQSIYAALAEPLAGPVHALALHSFSPDEWQAHTAVPDSPNCLGGGR